MTLRNMLLSEETVFKNMGVFNPDFIPDNFPHRELQMEALALCLRPALRGGRPVNTVVLGACATGKTTTVKKIFDLVDLKSHKIMCVYINCQLHTTRFNIFSQIYQKIFGHAPPETGIPFSRIYQAIMQHLTDKEMALVVALDDVSYLFHSKTANKIFYDILRAHEEFPGVRTGIFAILSDIEFRHMLDKNVNTVFIPQEVVFNPYTREEMRDILRERVDIGFYPKVISDDLLDLITSQAFSTGDLRVGIDLLRVAGNQAEADASKTIKEKHIWRAVNNIGPVNLKYTLETLSQDEKKLLETIVFMNDRDLVAGRLFEFYHKETGLSYATFIRILDKLEFLRLIDTKFTGSGVKGNSRFVILRFNPEYIMKSD